MRHAWILAGVYAFLTACAPMGGSNLERRVEEQDIQLREMRSQQADAWNEAQSLREEVARLKGQMERMNGAVASGSQPAMGLRQEGDGQGVNAGTSVEPVTGIVPGRAPESSAYAEGNYGLPAEPAAGAQAMTPAEAPTEATWGKADPKPQEPAPQKDISLALFDAGVNDYNARKYEAAERSFRDFLKNYPKHTQTAEAQYYMGECLFARGQFPQAALEYDTVIKKYPKSSSAPGAYYKQAICFSKMKQPAAAKMQMQAVISKYPNSPEAARAKAFLKTNK